MRNHNSKNWIRFLIAASSILILFSCFAPVVFSYGSSNWDFTETGQIGDTIGGITSPFIGVAGVLTAFLAFYIQYEANKVQREQFITSLNSRVLDEKIDSYNTLKLLVADMHGVAKDFESRLKYLEDYIGAIEKDPYALAKLYRSPLYRYERLRESDRMAIFKGFHYFIKGNDKMTIFSQLFSAIDYLPESLGQLYNIVNYHEQDVFQYKSQLREKLIEIETESVSYCNEQSQGEQGEPGLKKTLRSYIEDYRNLLSLDKETDLAKLKELINTASKDIQLSYHLVNRDFRIKKILIDMSDSLIVFSAIEQNTNHIIAELRGFLNVERVENSTMLKFRKITTAIDTAIAQTSEEQIRKEFLCQGT